MRQQLADEGAWSAGVLRLGAGAHDLSGSGAARMTSETERTWAAATEPELIIAQILAIDAWHRTWRTIEEPPSQKESREGRLERVRQVETLQAVQAALHEHAARHLEQQAADLARQVPVRGVVAVRDPWLRDALCTALESYGIEMVARLANGAEALGATIVEQPDLLLVEDAMSYLRGADVLREAQQFAPRTLVAIQVDRANRLAELAAAGADAVLPRNRSAADVAHDLAALVASHRPPQD